MTTPAAAASVDSPSEAAAAVFLVRRMVPGDLAFVMDSWLRSAWHQENRKLRQTRNSRERERAGRDWFDVVRPKVEILIRQRTTTVLVACDRSETNHLAGWVAFGPTGELRSHIKHAYRPWGVAALLKRAMDDELIGDTPRRLEIL